MGNRIKNSFSAVLAGYRNFIMITVKIMILLLAAVIINIVIIYPLWYTAIRYTKVYTAAAGILFSLLLLFVFSKSMIRKISSEQRPFIQLFIRPVIGLIKLLFFAGSIYFTAVMFHMKYFPAAAAGAVAVFLAGGFMFFRNKGY